MKSQTTGTEGRPATFQTAQTDVAAKATTVSSCGSHAGGG